jgi:hypothetical protein
VPDTVEVSGLAQQALAALQLALERGAHALDHGGLALQVGDQAGALGKPGKAGEGGAALEVHQHEAEQLGWVGEREAEHQAAQQLALAGAGGADDQPVRAHAAVGRFLQVEHQRLVPGADADGDAQQLRVRPGPPAGARVGQVHPARLQQVEQPDLVRRGGPVAVGLQPQRRQAPGDRLAQRLPTLVGDDAAVSAAVRPGLLEVETAAGRDEHAGAQLGGLVAVPGDQAEHGSAEPRSAGEQFAHGGQAGEGAPAREAVEHHHEVRAWRRARVRACGLAQVEARRAAQVRGWRLAQVHGR